MYMHAFEIGYFLNVFLEVADTTLPTVPLDQTANSLVCDGELTLCHSCITPSLWNQVALWGMGGGRKS